MHTRIKFISPKTVEQCCGMQLATPNQTCWNSLYVSGVHCKGFQGKRKGSITASVSGVLSENASYDIVQLMAALKQTILMSSLWQQDF